MREQSSKEIDDLDRFEPTVFEQLKEIDHLLAVWFMESRSPAAQSARVVGRKEITADFRQWVADETRRRIDADTLENSI